MTCIELDERDGQMEHVCMMAWSVASLAGCSVHGLRAFPGCDLRSRTEHAGPKLVPRSSLVTYLLCVLVTSRVPFVRCGLRAPGATST